jgi:tRNA threonylcarbamoyladenosine biosynthesis protein TsaE
VTTASFFLADLAATCRLGIALGQRLTAGSVLLLEGELGSGKTSLVQGIGQGLGIADVIVSPTFTLINEYPDGRVPLYHLDLYRLSSQQVEELSLELYWQGVEVPPGIVAIEWSEYLLYRPRDYLRICLHHQGTARQAELRLEGNLPSLDLNQLRLAVESKTD